MLDDNLRPIPQTNVDYTSLPINPTPEEYFLLSRINGNVTVGEICQISGLSIEATHKALARLQEAGLIKIPEPEKKTAAESGMYDSVEGVDFGQEEVAAPAVEEADAASSAPSESKPAPEHRPPPKVEVMGTSMLNPAPELDVDDGLGPAFFDGWPVAFSAYSFDPDALNESVSISDELKRYILYIHAHIDKVDYYKVLNVARDAGRKEVRASYFTLSKIFHPDSFYGKETGSYSEKIDDIFQGLSKAHQVLSNKNKRSEYDATLASAESAPSAPSSPRATAPAAADVAQSGSGSSGGQAVDKKKEMAFGVLVKRGEKHEAAGEYVEAAAEYKKAFAIKHDPLVALRGANLLMRSGEEHIDDAILLAKAAAKEDPSNAKPLILIGDAYEEKGDYESARDYYERARAVEPDNKVVGRRLKYLETAAH